ncbi:UNVERIFIED_CONTAM: putative amidohydrolase YtcJ [Brevibacillus sp. OAP136]
MANKDKTRVERNVPYPFFTKNVSASKKKKIEKGGNGMKKMKLGGVLLTAMLFGQSMSHVSATTAPVLTQTSQNTADTVFSNGSVYTVDKNRNWAEAVAVRGDKIVYVGSNKGVQAYIGSKTNLIDLHGKMLLPGFFDAHIHASATVKMMYEVNLYGLGTMDNYLKEIAQFVHDHPDNAFILGGGWSNTVIPGKGPDKRLLDTISKEKPIVLTSEDGHSSWANSKALALAGITTNTKDPAGGVIERDRNGEPLGTLRDSAQELVKRIIPPYTVKQYKTALQQFEKMAAERGITSAHEPMLSGAPSIEAYRNLGAEGKLTVRFRNSLLADPSKGVEQVSYFEKERAKNNGPLFQTNTIKFFMDGVVEGSTALLKEKYHHVDSYGEQIWDKETLKKTASAVDKAGFQMHIHAIGDAAVAMSLDTIEYAQKQNGKRDARHSITHLQLVSPADIIRFQQDGVVPVAQPFWAFKEPGYYSDIQVPYLGEERAEKEYPIKSFMKLGLPVPSSSDFPVTQEFGPLHSIEIGVTRLAVGSTSTEPKDVLWPEERATLADMIASVTIDGAYATFTDNITGSIEIGKKADLVVLDKNLFTLPVNQIHNAKVLLTLFEGKPVFRDVLLK